MQSSLVLGGKILLYFKYYIIDIQGFMNHFSVFEFK